MLRNCIRLFITLVLACSAGTAVSRAQSTPSPNRSAPTLNVVYVGFSKFARNKSTQTAADPASAALESSLGTAEYSKALGVIVLKFFENIQAANPANGLRVTSPESGQIIDDTLDDAAFATMALSSAAVVDRSFQPPGGNAVKDRILYVSVPMLLIAAKTYETIYARPFFLEIKLDEAITLDSAPLRARILEAIATVSRRAAADPNTARIFAQCLARWRQGGTGIFRYEVPENGVRLSNNASAAATGFQNPAKVSGLLREALSFHLAEDRIVFPPLPENLDYSLYQDVGARYFGLEVITDLKLATGVAETSSGRVILPVRRWTGDLKVTGYVKTGVKWEPESRDFKFGRCQLVLEVAESTLGDQVISQGTIVAEKEFAVNKAEQSNGFESQLLQLALQNSGKVSQKLKEK